MAKLSKEQRAHLDGMAFALKIVRESGLEGLEKEMEFRGWADVPLNVSSNELIAASRGRAGKELMFMATASAATLVEYMKLPPSRVLDYLKEFNNRVTLYQHDPDEYQAAQERLDKNLGISEVCRVFVEEEENGK